MTGRSTLTYHVGCIDYAVQLRIFHNTGSGYFSQEWIPFDRMTAVLESVAVLTSNTLKPIFTGTSVNTAGFVMAVLKDMGLITPTTGNQRSYQATEDDGFINEVQALMVSEVIEEPEKPAKKPASSKKPVSGMKTETKSATGTTTYVAAERSSEDTSSSDTPSINTTSTGSPKVSRRLHHEILRLASAYFAQTEPDCCTR